MTEMICFIYIHHNDSFDLFEGTYGNSRIPHENCKI